MTKICRRCEVLLNDGDLIKATVIARFVDLPSKISYSLTRPTACLYLEHARCSDPQGEYVEIEGD